MNLSLKRELQTREFRKINDFQLLYSSTFGHMLDPVGPQCGAVKQLKRAILMSSQVLQFPLMLNIRFLPLFPYLLKLLLGLLIQVYPAKQL